MHNLLLLIFPSLFITHYFKKTVAFYRFFLPKYQNPKNLINAIRTNYTQIHFYKCYFNQHTCHFLLSIVFSLLIYYTVY